MGKVIWSPTAHNDIDLIAEYIAQDSVERAALFVTKLMEQTDRLKTYPMAGRKIPELNETSKREIIYGSYRIMYQIINKSDVWITSVVHGARDWRPK